MFATALQRGNRSAQYAPHMLRVRKAGSVRRAGSAGTWPKLIAGAYCGLIAAIWLRRSVMHDLTNRTREERWHLESPSIGVC